MAAALAAGPGPAELSARNSNAYASPFVSPVTSWRVVFALLGSISVQSGSHVMPSPYRISYPDIDASSASVHVNVTSFTPAVARRPAGAFGVIGITLAVGPKPASLNARSSKVYDVTFVNPDTSWRVVFALLPLISVQLGFPVAPSR